MKTWLLLIALALVAAPADASWFFSYTLHNQDGKVIDLRLIGEEVAVVTEPAIVRHEIVRGFDTDVHCERIRGVVAEKLKHMAPKVTSVIDPACTEDRVQGRRPR